MHHPRAPVLVFRRVPGVVFPRSCLFPLSRSRCHVPVPGYVSARFRSRARSRTRAYARSWLRSRTRATRRLQAVHLVVFGNHVVKLVDITFKQLVHLALFVHNVANSHLVLFCKRY